MDSVIYTYGYIYINPPSPFLLVICIWFSSLTTLHWTIGYNLKKTELYSLKNKSVGKCMSFYGAFPLWYFQGVRPARNTLLLFTGIAKNKNGDTYF